MAYPTSASLNTALLQQLNFRGAGNTPISSLYTLYANGKGQTYWSNSVNPAILSSFSTSIGSGYAQVESDLQTAILSTNAATSTLIYNTLGDYSQQSSQIAVIGYTLGVVLNNEAELSTNMSLLSTGVNTAFLSTANSFQIQLDSYYQSTMNAAISTLNAISSVSSFYSQIQSTTNLTQVGLSTLSTALYTQNASTYTTLLSIFNTGLTSTSVWTAGQISSLSSVMMSIGTLNNFSTQINSALLSTSGSLQSYISSNTAELAAHDSRISTLEYCSSGISTASYLWISSFYSTNVNTTNILVYNQSTILGSTIQYINQLSTSYAYSISSLTGSTLTNIIAISSLNTQLSTITTSSILSGIYSTFMQLEDYTVGLMDELYSSSVYILSTTISTSVSATSATQLLTLANTNSLVSMDFANYRNFNINVYSIQDSLGSPYRVTYNPIILGPEATYQGLITVNISTIGQSYTQNNNLLCLDMSRWGIINNGYQSTFPMLANSDYTIEYQYNILNNCVYTNILNIYPRMLTTNLSIAPNSYGLNIYEAGDTLNVSWNNYMFSTFGLSHYIADINVNITIQASSNITTIYGPYKWPTSNVNVYMPSTATGPTSGTLNGYVQTYFTGQYANATTFGISQYFP